MREINVCIPKTFQLTDAEFHLIQSLYNLGQKLEAAIFIKTQYNIETLEAKYICDAVHGLVF